MIRSILSLIWFWNDWLNLIINMNLLKKKCCRGNKSTRSTILSTLLVRNLLRLLMFSSSLTNNKVFGCDIQIIHWPLKELLVWFSHLSHKNEQVNCKQRTKGSRNVVSEKKSNKNLATQRQIEWRLKWLCAQIHKLDFLSLVAQKTYLRDQDLNLPKSIKCVTIF